MYISNSIRKTALIGLDIGTTSLKTIAIDSHNGATIAKAVYNYPIHRNNGFIEQDPNDWIIGASTTLRKVQQCILGYQTIGIGICSQANTHVLVDDNFNHLTAAITWKDQRCIDIAKQLNKKFSEEQRLLLFGGPFQIDASFSLSRLEWWRINNNNAFQRARAIMLPKDYLTAKLTRVFSADALSAIGLVGIDGNYIPEVLSLVPRAEELCAPLRPFDSICGTTTTTASVPLGVPPGIPVLVGTMDAIANVFGSGLFNNNNNNNNNSVAMEVSGTSEILAVLGDNKNNNNNNNLGVIRFPPINNNNNINNNSNNKTLWAGPTQTGGDALLWFSRVMNRSVDEILAAAARAKKKSRLLFLPHLDGERSPYWNGNAQGVFLGLDRDSGVEEMARSVLEGVAYSARHVLNNCEIASGQTITTIRLSGGGSKSEIWNKIKCDIHGKDIEVLEEFDSAAKGIALLINKYVQSSTNNNPPFEQNKNVQSSISNNNQYEQNKYKQSSTKIYNPLYKLDDFYESHIKIKETIHYNKNDINYYNEKFEIYKDTYQSLVKIFDRNQQ